MGPEIKSEYIDVLITKLNDDIRLLTFYQQGKTFDEIAELMEETKTSIYQRFRQLVGANLFEAALPKDY